jgi:CPA1 family monovalent cation:H+ antiporter
VVLEGIDFNKALMHGMLSFLLFSGALHCKPGGSGPAQMDHQYTGYIWCGDEHLYSRKHCMDSFLLIGLKLPFIYCLLFGSLIAPTDPIAVIGILKKAGVPKSLETKITGESLFNDGVAVVVFLVIMGIVTGGHDVTAGHINAPVCGRGYRWCAFRVGHWLGWLTGC